MVSGTSFKEYPKYDYSPYKLGLKSQFLEPISQSLADIFRKTPFVFKGDSGRPRILIPAKVTPISFHQHIKIITGGYYLICRNSKEI